MGRGKTGLSLIRLLPPHPTPPRSSSNPRKVNACAFVVLFPVACQPCSSGLRALRAPAHRSPTLSTRAHSLTRATPILLSVPPHLLAPLAHRGYALLARSARSRPGSTFGSPVRLPSAAAAWSVGWSWLRSARATTACRGRSAPTRPTPNCLGRSARRCFPFPAAVACVRWRRSRRHGRERRRQSLLPPSPRTSC